MADEKKVKVIDYEAAWNALKLTLRDLGNALDESSVSPLCSEYVVGKLTAYDNVLSLMHFIEELNDEAE